jgi:hypothetical protein
MFIAILAFICIIVVMADAYKVSFAYLRDYRKTKRAMTTDERVCVYQAIFVPIAVVIGEWWFFHQ